MVSIKILIPAGEARSGPPLAPILGQHQINLVEFCKAFNAASLNIYSHGVPVRITIKKSPGYPTKYSYKPITFYSLMMNFCLHVNKNKFLTYSQAFDIFCIRLRNLDVLDQNILPETKQKLIAKELFGFFSSSGTLLKL